MKYAYVIDSEKSLKAALRHCVRKDVFDAMKGKTFLVTSDSEQNVKIKDWWFPLVCVVAKTSK